MNYQDFTWFLSFDERLQYKTAQKTLEQYQHTLRLQVFTWALSFGASLYGPWQWSISTALSTVFAIFWRYRIGKAYDVLENIEDAVAVRKARKEIIE